MSTSTAFSNLLEDAARLPSGLLQGTDCAPGLRIPFARSRFVGYTSTTVSQLLPHYRSSRFNALVRGLLRGGRCTKVVTRKAPAPWLGDQNVKSNLVLLQIAMDPSKPLPSTPGSEALASPPQAQAAPATPPAVSTTASPRSQVIEDSQAGIPSIAIQEYPGCAGRPADAVVSIVQAPSSDDVSSTPSTDASAMTAVEALSVELAKARGE